MKLRLIREPTSDGATLGVLFIDQVWFCWTLEDPIRDVKIPHQTCIPPGFYDVALTHSPKFGRVLPEVLNVPGFTGIRIHPGNDAGDTDGCILCGYERGDAVVTHSRQAHTDLEAQMHLAVSQRESIVLEIENPEPSE